MNPNEARWQLPSLAACTGAVVDACVTAVASELVDLSSAIPGLDAREVALIARGALEVAELEPRFSELMLGDEPRCSDWALTTLAELRHQVATLGRKGDQRRGALFALADRAYELAAASDDRSPVLFYGELLFTAAESLTRRGDALGLTRQVECLAEELTVDEAPNALAAMRELARLQLLLGRHEAGLGLVAELLEYRPADLWTHNGIAMLAGSVGLPSLAFLAATRGLQLLRAGGDPERLTSQLEQFAARAKGKADRSDAPVAAVQRVRELLTAEPGPASSTPIAEFARRVVPDVVTARVKVLPPMPSPSELSEIARRLRALPRALPTVPVSRPAPSTGPKVGRNELCPCGSGKKFKRCCG